jgi:hypothetical protein
LSRLSRFRLVLLLVVFRLVLLLVVFRLVLLLVALVHSPR